MIALGLALTATTAALFSATLGLRSALTFALATYLFAIAEIVVVVEALSPARLVTEHNVLLIQAAVALAALGVWGGRRQPLPRISLRDVRLLVTENPPLAVLGAVVFVALGYELALVLGTPPNNWDSMTYHLSRAAGWYQRHGVGYLQAHTQRENAYQPNAEVLVLYTFLFTHGDRFAALWQWLAEPATMIAVVVLSRRVGFGRAESLFCSLLFASLAQVALQSVTTQNDLVTASLVAATAVFIVERDGAAAWLATLAIGLALGTKLTTAFALPGLVLIAAAGWGRAAFRRFALPIVLLLPIVAAYGYVLNLVNADSILGPATAYTGLAQTSLLGAAKTIAGVLLGITIDLRAFPSLPANEDLSYFGMLGLVLVIPAYVLAIRRWRRSAGSPLEHAIVLTIPLYLLALASAYRYNLFVGRYLISAAALGAPLFAVAYPHRRYTAIIVAVSSVSLGATLLFDHAKPSGLGDGTSIWAMTRVEAQSLQRPAMLPVLKRLAACVPESGRIGYAIGGDDWDYPLYGQDLSRTLVPLGGNDPLAEAARDRLEWVLLRRRPLLKSAPGWKAELFPGIGLELFARFPRAKASGARESRCITTPLPRAENGANSRAA